MATGEPEPYEADTPCDNKDCLHRLGDHLNGWARHEHCDLCDCPQFLTATDCPACYGQRVEEDHRGREHPCTTCGGSGNA